MPTGGKSQEELMRANEALARENEELRAQLAQEHELRAGLSETEDVLTAIRNGEVDALLISTPEGERIYTLEGADTAYRVLVESMQEGAVTLLADGSILYANQRFAHQVGQSLEKILGTSFDRYVHPDDRDIYQALRRECGHNHSAGEIRLLTSGGQCLSVLLSLNILRLQDLESTCIVVTDLSAQKRSEQIAANERLARAILEQAAEAVIVCDNQGIIIRASNKAHQVCGCNPLLRPFAQAFPLEKTNDSAQGAQQEAFSLRTVFSGKMFQDNEVRLTQAGGADRYFLLNAGPLRIETAGILGAVITLTEITERKRFEQALRQANEQLQDTDRRKDEFLAMLAHELRNPLTPVRYAVQIMNLYCGECPTNGRIARQREIIERQISHMSRLIDDLLDVARITQGKIELRRELIDFSAVLRQSIESCRLGLEQKRQELLANLPAEPLWMEGDPTRLEQVFTNILGNAIKYSPPDKRIWVSVILERDNGPGSMAVVKVRDEGEGINPELLPYIFDLFTQGERGKDRTQGGLGIGLTMERSLVQMHGGHVEVCTEGPGKGSEFTVRLPLMAEMIHESTAPGNPTLSPAIRPLKILVVDDLVDTAQSLAELLEMWGHQMRVAYNGAAVLEIARTWHPEVILLDIGMPGMDGYEVTRRLRAEHGYESIKIVALTGYGQETDRMQAQESGFDGYLVKPVNLDNLFDLLTTITK